MNQFTTELDALGRIVSAIKAYRDWTTDSQSVVDNKAVDGYLEGHLSIPDWAFWQQLQIRERVLLRTTRTRDQ